MVSTVRCLGAKRGNNTSKGSHNTLVPMGPLVAHIVTKNSLVLPLLDLTITVNYYSTAAPIALHWLALGLTSIIRIPR